MAGRSFQTILADMREGTHAYQTPSDFLVQLGYGSVLYAAIRTCIEAGAFKLLAEASQPLTCSVLARKLNGVPETDTDDRWAAREEYIERMLRAVAGLHLVDETAPHTFQANELTRTLAEPGFDLGYRELLDNALGPHSTLSHMTDWAMENKYIAPDKATDGPFQRARGIVGTTTFQHWVKDDPASLSNLSALMKIIQRDRLNWSSWFPHEALFETPIVDDKVFMVDIGGGLGHDLMGLAARYPDRKFRLIVEDLTSVIAETRAEKLDPRIELLEYDFFTPQPIRGAQIYFMHKIMHDWPDAECVQILTHIRDAMSPKSRIFINDCIIPDKGSPLIYATFDICMFVQLGAKERSESMWYRLIDKVAGLEIRKFWQPKDLKGEGIVEIGIKP